MQNQKQPKTPIGMSLVLPSRLHQQPPQHPQQFICIPRAELPLVMSEIQRNIIEQSISGSSNLNSLIPSVPSEADVKLIKWPFYEVIADIFKPMTLNGSDRCSLKNVSKGMREVSFKFCLSPQHATNIAMNRDISKKKIEFLYQFQIRTCLFEPDSTELTDFRPNNLHIRINNKFCELLETDHKIRTRTEVRQPAQPISDCTQYLKLNPTINNSIILNWIPDGKIYVVGMFLVKKLTSMELLQKLYEKKPKSSKDTKNYVLKSLADVNSELTTTSYQFCLVCPLGKIRMEIPTKSTKCVHLQCFDARTFILMNEIKPTWKCPICHQPCLYDDLQIQSYFLEVVSSPNLPDECKEIELLADGAWKVYEENKKPVEIVADVEGIPIDFVNLDESNDKNYIEV